MKKYRNQLLEEYDKQLIDVLTEDERNTMVEYSFYTVEGTITFNPFGGGDDCIPEAKVILGCCCADVLCFGMYGLHEQYNLSWVPSICQCMEYVCQHQNWSSDAGVPILATALESCCVECGYGD